MRQHKLHDQHQQDDPHKAQGKLGFVCQRYLKDRMEPAVVLLGRRPRNREGTGHNRAKSARNHTGTQRRQERRKSHDRDQHSVGKADSQSKQDGYQHRQTGRHIVETDQAAARKRVADHAGSDGQIHAAGNQRKRDTNRHQGVIVGNIHHAQEGRVLSEV